MEGNVLKQPGNKRATVDARLFSDALKKVTMASRKSLIPILSEICVRFANGECCLTGTNLNAWIEVRIPATGSDFAFVFSRSKEVERVCRYFDGAVTVELADFRSPKDGSCNVTLSCGTRSAEFGTYAVEDYPCMPENKGTVSFSVIAGELMERIERVSYAAERPTSESRQIRSCVEFVGNQVFALDGFRAAWDTAEEQQFPQPFLALAEQLRLLKLFENTQVDFSFSKPYIFVTGGCITVILRQIDEEPFKMQSAIPQKYIEEFSVSPQMLLEELKYLGDVSPKARPSCLYLRGSDLYVMVNGRRFTTAIDVKRQSDLLLGVNLRYMTEALKQFAKVPAVKIKLSGPCSPIVIEAEGRTDCAMVLPVRVRAEAAA